MHNKTILIIDDEKGFVEALEDALIFEGYSVLTANNATDGMHILETKNVDLITVDIMMPPGSLYEGKVDSHNTGIFLCQKIREKYPSLYIFCISVINDPETIKNIQKLRIQFLKKGEVSLRTLLNMIQSKITGLAYSTDPNFNKWRRPKF